MPFAFAILSSALYGCGDFLGGLASRRAPVLLVAALSQAIGLVALLVALPFFPGVVRAADMGWGVAAGLTGTGGVVLLYHALATGTVSTVAPLISMIALAVPVAVGIAGGERPGLAIVLGIVAGAAAVALVSGGAAPAGAPSRVSPRRALAVAFASGLLIGAFLVCLGRVQSGAGLWPLVASRACGVAGMGLLLALRRNSLRPAAGARGPIIGAGVADVTANLLYVLAVQGGTLSQMATIVSLAPAATVLLAQLVLHERLAAVQKAGVALAMVALVLLSQGTSR